MTTNDLITTINDMLEDWHRLASVRASDSSMLDDCDYGRWCILTSLVSEMLPYWLTQWAAECRSRLVCRRCQGRCMITLSWDIDDRGSPCDGCRGTGWR